MKRCSLWLLALSMLVLTAPAMRAQDAIDQTTRLATLGRVWGLAKYFHPDVTIASGSIDWDAVLIEYVPRVAAATTKAQLNDELLRLLRRAGPEPRLPSGVNASQAESDSAFAWIDDGTVFESSTRAYLKAVRNATVPAASRYVRTAPANNPDFSGETPWTGGALPNEANRLLALFRYWNMVQYYFPNRDITDQRWSEVLPEFVPRVQAATTEESYHLTISELISHINDSHGVVTSNTMTAYRGVNQLPIRTRYIQSQTVVTKVFQRYINGAEVRVGDVISEINGVPIANARARYIPYIAASNAGSQQRIVDQYLLRTNADSMTVTIQRSGVSRAVTVNALALATISVEEVALEAQQPKWQTLPGNIGYVHMGLVLQADVASMFAALRNTRAIIFDQRNYPNFTLYEIAARLNPRAVDFVTITGPDYRKPGTFPFVITLQAGPTTPRQDYYRGKVIILADERTQSQAEFTIMALRTAPDVTVVGSPTSGADGNVTTIDLPGGIRTLFSGIGIFYPDMRPTQRVGILPDITVTPTVQGIRDGVDEVLQRGLALVP